MGVYNCQFPNCCCCVGPQASDVSRSRGASLMARPGNSLVAAIRSQHHADPQQLSAPCKHPHSSSLTLKSATLCVYVLLALSHQPTTTRSWRSSDSPTSSTCCRSGSPASAETTLWGTHDLCCMLRMNVQSSIRLSPLPPRAERGVESVSVWNQIEFKSM